jgi:hypothetical protein
MAKKKNKGAKKDRKDRKKHRRAVAGNALLGTFAGGVVGKVAERLIVNEIESLIQPLRHKGHKEKAHANGQEDDVAGRLLTVLADGGSKPVAQLLVETQLGLSKLLHALQTLRDFRLVNFVGEPGEETVEVTRSGSHTVTALRKNHIHEEAAKLLAS